MSNKINQTKWEKDCANKHHNKYDYSLVDLENRRNDGKVPIICHEKDCGEEHGIFWQLPNQHKFGKGCPKCRLNKQEDILSIFKKVHGDKYDYSLVEYKGMNKNILVICKKCKNIFEVSPTNHKKGRGCPICAIERRKEKLKLPLKKVKEIIDKKFNGKYDLSHIDYKNVDERIKLMCPIHGEFWQTPYMLFKGHGCPKCGQSVLENEIQILLDKNGIKSKFEANKKDFEWLGMKSLDFYLPDYNIAIECQGIQHFGVVRFGGVSLEDAKEKYNYTVKCDLAKRELCQKHNIKLLYYSNLGIDYPYNVFEDKNLLLNEILKTKK